jgi:hypothetical protein
MSFAPFLPKTVLLPLINALILRGRVIDALSRDLAQMANSHAAMLEPNGAVFALKNKDSASAGETFMGEHASRGCSSEVNCETLAVKRTGGGPVGIANGRTVLEQAHCFLAVLNENAGRKS